MSVHSTISTANAAPMGEITVVQPRAPKMGFRAGLETAFRRLGASVGARDAYRRTKGFYRSGGAWPRELG